MREEIETDILKLLSSSRGYLSGERIGQELKIPRTVIWERINKLRAWGCKITSHPFRGYHLMSTPDKFLPPLVKIGLKSSRIAREVYYYPQVDSTNRRAKTMAAQGALDGTLIITDYQTEGQGRLKRKWLSPQGKSLLFSLIFYPKVIPPKVFQLTLLASLSVCKTLISHFKIAAGIKWPNDIYVNNRKICGILTEFSANADRVKWAVVGIGLNVNFDPSTDPEVSNIATSIKRELGKTQQRLPLLKGILEEIDNFYDQFLSGDESTIREGWLSHSLIVGKPVVILSDDLQEEGTAETIDENGALILRTPQGKRKKIIAGDVSLRIQETEVRTQDKRYGLKLKTSDF